MAKQLPRLEKCLNCGSAVSGNYCAHCGQENEDQTVALRYLFSDVMSEIIAIDSKLFRTIVPLLIQPGYITQQYNAGKRVRYLSPLKMYLVASLFFFLVASFRTPSIQKPKNLTLHTEMPADARAALTDALKRVPQNALTHSQLEKIAAVTSNAVHEPESAASHGAKPNDSAHKPVGDETKAATPAPKPTPPTALAPASGKPAAPPAVAAPASATKPSVFFSDSSEDGTGSWVKARALKLRDNPRALLDKALDTAPKVMFVVLPLFALILKMLYARRKRLYVEHLIFGLHYHAFVFTALGVMLLVQQFWFTLVVGAYISIYLVVAMRKVYDQGYPKTILKFLLLSWAYSFVQLLGFIAVFGIAFATL